MTCVSTSIHGATPGTICRKTLQLVTGSHESQYLLLIRHVVCIYKL